MNFPADASALASTSPVSFLLISDSYPPVVGGSEVEAQRVCSAMLARGHRALVLCAGGDPMPPVRDWVDPAGVPVRILTHTETGRWRDLTFALRVAWTIWRERHNYQIVYFLMQGLHLAFGLPVARMTRKPIVMKVAGSGVIPLMRSSRAGRLELHWLRKWAARLMILNDGMAEEAVANGFPRSQLLWMPNPVDTEQFCPGSSAEVAELRSRFALPPQAPIIVYVGRLSPEKGLTWLLEAFAKAVSAVPSAMLVLLGDGAQRPELEALAQRLSLGPHQIRFAGRVPVSEVPLWLRASDIFALLSPSEGFSCALAEAMAAGLPSVVSAIPANSQLIDPDVHGILVPTGDIAAIAAAFVRLLREDPLLRLRMGQAARQRVLENFSTPRIVSRYETLFHQVLNDPNPPAPQRGG